MMLLSCIKTVPLTKISVPAAKATIQFEQWRVVVVVGGRTVVTTTGTTVSSSSIIGGFDTSSFSLFVGYVCAFVRLRLYDDNEQE